MKRILILICFISLIQNHEASTEGSLNQTKPMIKLTIFYPNGEGKTFDMDIYENKHMPMLKEIYGSTLKKLEIDKGISGRTPDEPIPFLAIGYLYYESIEAYQEIFKPNADRILGDIPNYTNITPFVQVSEVIESSSFEF
ncbi:MAG: EthD family reductase [Bacteroidota bacterium]